jgi:RNA polymerase sigma-70 factor (ECF subfamily)
MLRCGPRDSDYQLLGLAREYVIQLLQGHGAPAELVQAWEQFHERYETLIRRFAIHVGISPPELDDAVQTAWTVVLQDLPSFQCDPQRGSFRAWLFVRVRNSVVDQMRRAAHRRERLAAFDLDVFPSDEREPPEILEQRWDAAVFQEAMQDLQRCVSAEDYRQFVQQKFEQRHYAELAAELGIPEATARTRVHRVMIQFSRLLTGAGYADLLFGMSRRD